MKKNLLYSVLAVCLMLFASCSQEEIVSTAGNGQGGGLVTVSVNMPDEATTRAMPSIEGYTRRCIMQVVDAEGTAIAGDDMRQVQEVTGETVSFSFTAPEEEYNVLFWADYVDKNINTDYLYTTTDLTNVTMTMNRYHMFQEYADAFCGSIKGGETSATLKRPFSLLTISVEDVTNYANYDQISIGEFTVPDGYNVFNKTTAATKTISLVTADDNKAPVNMVDAKGGVWAYVYVFAPVDATSQTLLLPITLHSSTSAAADLTFNATSTFAWDENMRINFPIPAEVPEEGEIIDITVDFGDGYENDPVVPTLEVGAYVNAAGEPVATAAEAVGVVFALGAGSGDTPAAYGTSYEGKTISAYAVALTNGARGAFGNGDETTAFPTLTPNDDFTSWTGYTRTAELEAMIGDYASVAFANYNTWVAANPLEGENVSPWYIPSYKQLETFCNLIFGEKADADFSAKLKDSFNTGDNKWFYISSTIREDGGFSAATIVQNAGTCTFGGAEPQITSSTCIRAVVTIFAD